MSRADAGGIQHPAPADEVTAKGLEHIGQCLDCRLRMPWLASQIPPPAHN